MRTKPALCKHYKNRIIEDLTEHEPSKASTIAERTGIPLRVVSNLLMRLRLSGHIRIGRIDTRNRSLWERTANSSPAIDAEPKSSDRALLATDPEHKAWMDYWRQRREDRLAHARAQHPPREARP